MSKPTLRVTVLLQIMHDGEVEASDMESIYGNARAALCGALMHHFNEQGVFAIVTMHPRSDMGLVLDEVQA